MEIEYDIDRIYLIPENEEDKKHLRNALPDASKSFCFFTLDAGKTGDKNALVITHSNSKESTIEKVEQ